MKQHIYILILSFTIELIACNSSTDQQTKKEIKSVAVDNIKKTETKSMAIPTKDISDDCVRGQAKPIIKKTVFSNTKFILQPDSLSAIETVLFDNGDKLTIRNWGCEYYVLTFSFETSNYKNDTTNFAYWYQTADQLMTSILAGIDPQTPIDIKRALVFFESYYLRERKNNYKNLKLAEEIEFDGSEIRSFVTLDRIEQINNQKFLISLSFVTGPL